MRRTAIALLLAMLFGGLVAAAAVWSIFGDRRFPTEPATVDVVPGTTVSAIADQLQASGVVSSGRLLLLYLRAKGLAAKIQAAEYDFPAHQTIPDVATVLRSGGYPAAVWITVPEGFTAAEIQSRLARQGLTGGVDFMQVVRETNLVIGGWRTRGLEGYLFPDTYLVPRHASAQATAALMTRQFMRALPPHAVEIAHRMKYSIPQIVIIASMIEREAKVDDERRLIAGVIYNRLHRGMPLEVDATIEYALPQHKNVLTFEDLALDSPYNTYRHTGLPPTPIANPGRKSLLAAFHPATVDYLYYVYRGGGRHQFSRTLQEQQAAERKYLR